MSSSGAEWKEILEEERIDLVISDVIMPDMDGLELCKKKIISFTFTIATLTVWNVSLKDL